MRFSLIGILLFFSSWMALSQPVITCLHVLNNGDVEINWLPYTGGGFENYTLFHSPDNSTYTVLSSFTDINQTNYVHSGASADISSQYYKLKVFFSGDSLVSDIQQTIFLFLDPSQAGVAILSWNPPYSSSGSSYNIWRKYASGNWTVIDYDYSGTFYNDVIDNGICETHIDYRIELNTPYNCSFNSNVQGDTFTEANYPANPVFDSVSINYFNDTPQIVLGWEPSVSPDVAGYIVYRQIGSSFLDVDTVYGLHNTFYIDYAVPACDTTYTYAIAAIDSCGNKSPGTFSEPLSNTRLIDVEYNPCRLEAVITFEPFIDLYADSMHFDAIGNSSLGKKRRSELLNWHADHHPNLRENTQIITIVDYDLKFGRTYDYYIRGTVYKNGTAYTTSSCIKSIYAYNYDRPDHIYFANADVLPDNNFVELTIDYDDEITDSYLKIWRTDAGTEDYNYLRTVYVDSLTQWPVKLTDKSADGSQGYYHYRIEVLDSCRNPWIESNELKTIFLRVIVKDKNHNLLQWNRFVGWNKPVAKYYIYRLDDETSPVILVDSVEWYADLYEYTDNISAISGSVERLIYWVQAVEFQENHFGFKEASNSNRIVVTPESAIYFPNAFKPGGTEPVFKPVFRFLGGSGYLFQIYNRWGQLIYETRDIHAGWNGTYKESLVEQGTYIYKFQYRDGFGNAVNKQGTVTVIY